MKTIAFILAVLVGKILILLSRLLGNQGSNFPGKVARRIYPLILRELATKVDGKIIVITGTNGKTTTSNMLAQIIKETGANLVHNQAGANMISGITTAFIEKTNLTGNRHFDFALLETDEANIPILLKEVNAGLVVITNFFRDQLDRYGELDNTIQVIKNALDNKKLDLLLNADDPLTAHFQNLRLVNCRYYGLISPNYATNYSNESREGRYCVNCGQELEYSAYFYAQLGKFLCPGCGNHNPQVDFSGHNLVMNPTIQIMVEEIPLKSPYQGFYNAYNIVAAVSAALTLGIKPVHIQEAIANYKPQAGRMETFIINNHPVILNLVKNPTGLNQSILAVIQSQSQKNLFFALNDKDADGKDISWIWDADIEVLEKDSEKITQIVCSGLRSGDIALRIKYAGYPTDRLIIESSLKEGIKYITNLKSETTYVLSTYTALFECRKILLDLQKQSQTTTAGRVSVRG